MGKEFSGAVLQEQYGETRFVFLNTEQMQKKESLRSRQRVLKSDDRKRKKGDKPETQAGSI